MNSHISSKQKKMQDNSEGGQVGSCAGAKMSGGITGSSRKGEIIQLLFFGGLTYDETAEVVGISPAAVHRGVETGQGMLASRIVPALSLINGDLK